MLGGRNDTVLKFASFARSLLVLGLLQLGALEQKVAPLERQLELLADLLRQARWHALFTGESLVESEHVGEVLLADISREEIFRPVRDRRKHSCNRVHEDTPICELQEDRVALDQLEDLSNDFQAQIHKSFHLQEGLL